MAKKSGDEFKSPPDGYCRIIANGRCCYIAGLIVTRITDGASA
jgi:hypothetical protein